MLVCLLCCLFLSGLLLTLASVSFRSCEDSFVYAWFIFVASSSSWTRSSSLRDFMQDGRYPGSHYYHCYASCFVLSLCCATYHLLFKPPKLPCQPVTFCTLPSKPLLGYVTAFLSPSYSVASCRWRLEVVSCWNIFYLLVGISLYCHVILMYLYNW